MNDKELERRLEQALSHAAPNDLEGILSRCETQKGIVIPMTQNNTASKSKKRWLSMAVAACLTLVIAGGGAGYYYQANSTVASIVSLDVNPSIELRVNKNEKVISATPMNDDAQTILEGMELKGTQVDVAMSAIIGSLLQHGYVDELANSILITVEDEDAQRGERLQQELDGPRAKVQALETQAADQERRAGEAEDRCRELERRLNREQSARQALEQERDRLQTLADEAQRLRPEAQAYAQFRDRVGDIECEAHQRAAALESATLTKLRQASGTFQTQYQTAMGVFETAAAHVNAELRKIEVTLSQLPRAMDRTGLELKELEQMLEPASAGNK